MYMYNIVNNSKNEKLGIAYTFMIGKNLRRLRRERGYKSYTKLADSFGCSDETVKKWENESVGISLGMLVRLADFLDCDIDYLLGRIETYRKETTDVMAATGLSEKAVAALQEMQRLSAIYLTRKEDVDEGGGWGIPNGAFEGKYCFAALEFFNDLLCSGERIRIGDGYAIWKKAVKNVQSTVENVVNGGYTRDCNDRIIEAQKNADATRYTLSRCFEAFVDEVGAEYEPRKKGAKHGNDRKE